MKLLYVVNRINSTSGVERILSLKTDYFIEKFNYEVGIIVINEKDTDITPFFVYNKNISIFDITKKNKTILGKLKSINTIINEFQPTHVIICIDDVSALYFPYFLNKKYLYIYERHNSKMVNFVKTSNSILDKMKDFYKKILLDYGGKRFDQVVVLSKDHSREWSYLKNINIINNPLIFLPDRAAKLENKKVLAVGRHARQKGFDLLLKSWVKVSEKHKDWTLEIYGKKTNSQNMLKLAEAYNIQDSVNFHDPVTNIADVYLESSIYALSSRFEGFPLVLLECMACGVPAVAFKCPCSINELINHNEDGIHVEVGNTDEFAESLMYLIENPEVRVSMGKKAKENIQRLSPEIIYEKWRNLFENTMS